MGMAIARPRNGMGAVLPVNTAFGRVLVTSYDYWGAVARGDRNLDGTYTVQGKAKLIEQHVPALIKASGGTLTPAQAREVLTKDITPVLIGAEADPSQTGKLDLFPNLKWWVLGGFAVIAGILVIRD